MHKEKKKKKTQNLKRAPDQIKQTALSTFGTVGYERLWQWATIAWEWVSERVWEGGAKRFVFKCLNFEDFVMSRLKLLWFCVLMVCRFRVL